MGYLDSQMSPYSTPLWCWQALEGGLLAEAYRTKCASERKGTGSPAYFLCGVVDRDLTVANFRIH